MSHEKFIHHERTTAVTATEEKGCYDVLEDETGVYVHNAHEGLVWRATSLPEAVQEAERRAEAFDVINWLPAWQAAVKGGELRGFWDWLHAEHEGGI